jgi:ectoine hydroxylase-related dioxygenase (phytanoyl-CoA dioxygenase family)
MIISIDHPLISNGYTLDPRPERLGPLTPSDPSAPISLLREQYQAQGYLWLKGLLPREDVLTFRRRFFTRLQEAGAVAPDSDPVDGLYSGHENYQMSRKIMIELVRTAAYESFCLHPKIWQFYEALLEGDPYLHKRKLIRHTRPHDQSSTGAHYDLTYLRAGTDRFCTSWIPIGDCPIEMGGLVYLEGSDAWGRVKEAEFSAKNAELPPEERINAFNKNMGETGWLTKDLPSLAERLNTRWLYADYEAGDMVVHSAYMIHAATVNEDRDGRMRLSTDIRYQRVRDEIDIRWENHWSYDDML